MANLWTDSDLATLRAGHAAGSPLGEIARNLGRSYNAVAHKAGRLGLRATVRPQRSAADLTAEIRARWGRMTNAEIATDLGLLYDRVCKLAAEAGMGTNPCTHNVPCGIAWRAPKGMTAAQVAWARRTIKAHLAGKPVTDSDWAEATMILGFAREPVMRMQADGSWKRRVAA